MHCMYKAVMVPAVYLQLTACWGDCPAAATTT